MTAAVTREQIVAAAEQLFAREGEAGLSMRRLAKCMDRSPALLYKHFESKDDIIQALCDEFFETFLARLETAADDPDARQGLAAGCELYIRLATEKPYHYQAAFSLDVSGVGEPDAPPAKSGEKSAPAAQAFDILTGQIGALFTDAGLDERTPQSETYARSVLASLHGLAMLLIQDPDFGEPDQAHLIPLHVQTVIAGLTKAD